MGFDIDDYGDTSWNIDPVYGPAEYAPSSYIPENWVPENYDFSEFETPWYEGLWEKTKDVAGGLSGYGLKAYQIYQAGKNRVADKQSLAFQLPQSPPPERQDYVMQSGQPAPAQASRIVMAGPGGGGINMNMVLIGAAILGAVFFLKGK